MTRAITNTLYGDDSVFWDFVYQAAVLGLGAAATLAVCIQISGI